MESKLLSQLGLDILVSSHAGDLDEEIHANEDHTNQQQPHE